MPRRTEGCRKLPVSEKFQRFSPLTSCQEAWWQAGRCGAGDGPESSPSECTGLAPAGQGSEEETWHGQ